MKKLKFCSLESLRLNKKQNKILSRSSIILDCHIGKNIYIHNGKKFNLLNVTSRMKGYRFGEFCLTRKSFSHKKKK